MEEIKTQNKESGEKPIERLCECNSHCDLKTNVSIEEAGELTKNGYIIIVDGCKKGPSEGDVFIESRSGYKVFIPED